VNKPADGVSSPIDFAGYRHKTDKSPALWVIEQLNESALKSKADHFYDLKQSL
jgi:hypothetical protein